MYACSIECYKFPFKCQDYRCTYLLGACYQEHLVVLYTLVKGVGEQLVVLYLSKRCRGATCGTLPEKKLSRNNSSPLVFCNPCDAGNVRSTDSAYQSGVERDS